MEMNRYYESEYDNNFRVALKRLDYDVLCESLDKMAVLQLLEQKPGLVRCIQCLQLRTKVM